MTFNNVLQVLESCKSVPFFRSAFHLAWCFCIAVDFAELVCSSSLDNAPFSSSSSPLSGLEDHSLSSSTASEVSVPAENAVSIRRKRKGLLHSTYFCLHFPSFCFHFPSFCLYFPSFRVKFLLFLFCCINF
jgi:hypothetical protein